MQFSELGLAKPILKTLANEGYETPTPIQQKAIPAILSGSDLLGIAQTGTGKTAAFALPILTHLANNPKKAAARTPRVLILSPTRELATQIGQNFRIYGKLLGVSVAVVFGGVRHRQQAQKLFRGVDILVATPGRLLDHIGEKNVLLGTTEILVLDEADQMLDMGFVKPIRQIVAQLPKKRQNLFLSATMPKQISKLANELLHNPVHVRVAPVSSTADLVSQRIILIERAKKPTLLCKLFADPTMERTLIFTRTKRGADRVTRRLEKDGIRAASIHGDKSQSQREAALNAFRKSKIRVLVATDIAARGIDVDGVSHVVNYELPEVPEAYVHRIGRTARAGNSGTAISFCDETESDLLRGIEKLTKLSIEREDRRGDGEIEEAKAGDVPPIRRQRRGAKQQQGEPPKRRRPRKKPVQRSRANEGASLSGKNKRSKKSTGKKPGFSCGKGSAQTAQSNRFKRKKQSARRKAVA